MNPNFTYSLQPSNTPIVNGTFDGTLGNTYTVRTMDAGGCYREDQITVLPGISVSATQAVYCTNSNGPTPIQINVTNYTTPNSYIGNIICTTPLSTFANFNNTIPPPTQAPPGVYIVSVENSAGCKANNVFNVNYVNLPSIMMNPEICPENTNSVFIGFGPLVSITTSTTNTYAWSPSIGSASNLGIVNTPPAATTTYTCTATSEYGCTASNTITIMVLPSPTVTASTNNAPCNELYTAVGAGTTSPYTYEWTGSIAGNGNPLVGNPVIALNNIPTTNGTYTVTVTDAKGCTGTNTGLYDQHPICCNAKDFNIPTTKVFSSQAPFNNATLAAITNAYGSNVITTNDIILIDGNVNINSNVTFYNCPNIHMFKDAQLTVTNGATLKFDGCNLKAHCEDMWNGMLANSPNETIEINNCFITDMKLGIRCQNGAPIKLITNQFQSNYIAVQLVNVSTTDYITSTGKCVIINNRFEGGSLLNPYTAVPTSFTGIVINNCVSAQIGEVPSSWNGGQGIINASGNEFWSVINGINIFNSIDNPLGHIYIYNPLFENISNNLGWSENQINSNLMTRIEGSGIYATNLATRPPTIHLEVQGDNNYTTFSRCDKAFIARRYHIDVIRPTVAMCFCGFSFDNLTGQIINVKGTEMHHVAFGILTRGYTTNVSAAPSLLSQNLIICRENPFQVGTTNVYPIGIRSTLTNVPMGSNMNNLGLTMQYNFVELNAYAGIGIDLLSNSAGTNLYKNFINLTNPNPWLVPSGTPNAACAMATNCSGVSIRKNHFIGANNYLTNANGSLVFSGLKLSNSRDCKIECNEFLKLPYGMHIVGDCANTTANVDQIKGNTFTDHGYGWYFDIGNSTLGKVGNFNDPSNNNVFTNSALKDPAQVAGIYRASSTPVSGGAGLYTNQYPITFTTASSPLNVFQIYTTTNQGLYLCPSNMMMMSNSANNISMSKAIEIAENDINNLVDEADITQEWEYDKKLLAELDENITLRNSDTRLANFYNQEQFSPKQAIVGIDGLNTLLADEATMTDNIVYDNYVNQMEIMNNAIVEEYGAEYVTKLANQFLIKELRNELGLLSENEVASLQALANLCPTLNGTGVYKARAIYNYFNPLADYNDAELCVNAVAMKSPNIKPKNLTARAEYFKLYPNPAEKQLTWEYDLKTNDVGQLTIHDMLGRLVKTILINGEASNTKIDISDIARGAFLYRYTKNGNVISTGKLNFK